MERKSEQETLEEKITQFGFGPMLEEMTHRTLKDKGIDGPTLAHVIEEVQTPFNIAYITATTGTSAFQNLVGITYEELPARIEAGKRALLLAGIKPGDRLLVTYPPLVSVFTKQALDAMQVEVCFLLRSSQDALLAALLEKKPQAVIGESRFLKRVLNAAEDLGLFSKLPKELILIAAGTPMDLELLEMTEQLPQAIVHDLYGCQEFGWLTLDGTPLRDDIWLAPVSEQKSQVVVGGLLTGDCFKVNSEGKIVTHSGQRMETNWETIIYETTAKNPATVNRTARTILRMKGKMVRVSERLITNAPRTVLGIRRVSEEGFTDLILSHSKTRMYDDLQMAQMEYQRVGKNDPVWKK